MHSFLSTCRKAGKELTDAYGNAPSDEQLSEALETTVARIKVRRLVVPTAPLPFAVCWSDRVTGTCIFLLTGVCLVRLGASVHMRDSC